MKILLLSHKFFPDIGGIESNSEILANCFFSAGHEVFVVTWSDDSSATFFPFKIIRNPNRKQLFQVHQWAEVVFENNPCLRMAWPNIFFNRPSVIALNTWLTRVDGKMGFQDRLKLIFLKRARKVIAVSNALRKRCWSDAIVISNPYKEEIFKILVTIDRTDDFVFLGRLVTDKGADLAVYAMQLLLHKTLTIIGNGPELTNLKNLVSELKLDNRVHFEGSLSGDALVKCLNRHKYILVPSIWEEPFGNVVLEGMACGCLPIVSNSGGLADAVGNAGITHERGNIKNMVEVINKVINNPVFESMIRKNAPDHLAKHHSKIIANRYLAVIKEATC